MLQVNFGESIFLGQHFAHHFFFALEIEKALVENECAIDQMKILKKSVTKKHNMALLTA
jgi:hypothetical protein